MQDSFEKIKSDYLGCCHELPDIVSDFFDMTREVNFSKTSFANIFANDPILQQRIFSYVNQTLSQADSFISINKAISLIGLHKFKNIVLVLSLFPLFQDAGAVDLFKSSLLSAYYAKTIASNLQLINPDDAFLLGFLLDIGKLPMLNKFGSEYRSFAFDENDSLIYYFSQRDEKRLFGYSHVELSEFVCKTWKLPKVIVDAIKCHHSPFDSTLPEVACIAYLSSLLVLKNVKFNDLTQKVFSYMNISKGDLISMVFGVDKKVIPFYEILEI